MNSPARFLDRRERAYALAAAALGALAFAAGLAWEPQRAWADLLLSNFFWLSVALGAAVFMAVHAVAGAGWPNLFRRVPEAMAGYLPAGALFAAALCFGAGKLYPWAGPEAADAAVRGKAFFLDIPAYCLCTAAYFAAWFFPLLALRSASRAQDSSGDVALTRRGVRLSALFLVLFGVSFSLASIHWIMSLEPRWYSTLYPWYLFTGAFVEGIAGMTVLLILLKRRGFFPQLNSHHLHDLGKYLFAFSVFWAYLWYSQYLLIWYSNIPDETTHYVARLVGGWRYLFWLNPVVNFAAPFCLLLTVRRKSAEGPLLAACSLILAGHALDVYLLVMPAVLPAGPRIGLLEPAVFLATGAAFLLLFDRTFAAAAPIPLKDPYLIESLHHGE